MSLGKKKTRLILSRLRDVRQSATMENAGFDKSGTLRPDPTEFVKEVTRLHRHHPYTDRCCVNANP